MSGVPDAEVDALGLLCPLPVLRAAAEARRQPPGALIAVLVDDPEAPRDVEAWCAGNGHGLEGVLPLPSPPGRPAWKLLVRLGAPAG